MPRTPPGAAGQRSWGTQVQSLYCTQVHAHTVKLWAGWMQRHSSPTRPNTQRSPGSRGSTDKYDRDSPLILLSRLVQTCPSCHAAHQCSPAHAAPQAKCSTAQKPGMTRRARGARAQHGKLALGHSAPELAHACIASVCAGLRGSVWPVLWVSWHANPHGQA